MIEEWNIKEYEFDKMCEICCEVYDPIEFLPKILPCCSKTFCLKCIKDNLKKNAKMIESMAAALLVAASMLYLA